MTTPKRFIDEGSDADAFERSVLRAELDAAPPAGAEGDVLRRVMAAVVPFGPGDPGPSAPGVPGEGGALGGTALGKSAATLSALGKGFALGIGVSVAAATGNHLLTERPFSSETSPPSASAVRARPDDPSATTGPIEQRKETQAQGAPGERGFGPAIGANHASDTPMNRPATPSVDSAPSAPSVASFPSDSAEAAASRLKEEAALLRRARAELRAGNLALAFATLEASRQRFTAPELSQEREALMIELLHRSGERTAAAARAREFLARFPESPHAASVRAFASEATQVPR